MQKNYYDILDVAFEATDEQIKKSYRAKALKFHPDKNNGDISFTSKFQEINEAYRCLKDPLTKGSYDIFYIKYYGSNSDSIGEGKYNEYEYTYQTVEKPTKIACVFFILRYLRENILEFSPIVKLVILMIIFSYVVDALFGHNPVLMAVIMFSIIGYSIYKHTKDAIKILNKYFN